jgi:predicted DNA-binding transcriptional regulator YafY
MDFKTNVEQTLAPYGLVAKSNTWYLVAGGKDHIRVLRVSKIIEAHILEETFEYPQDFNLPTFWKSWCEDFKKKRLIFSVTARVSPELIEHLPHIFDEHTKSILAQAGEPDERGHVILTLPFDSFEAARSRILSWGRAVEVLEPLSLRMSVNDFAQQIVNLYDQ